MRVHSYIVRKDGGFSPNPFHGFCTLACCKPRIRRYALTGDVVVGLSKRGERVVYAMRVAAVLSFDEYWSDPRFALKRPGWRSTRTIERVGDNIYEPIAIGEFRQLPSAHSSRDGTEDVKKKEADIGGENVLVADRFGYFGQDGPPLPAALTYLKIGRGHRNDFSADQVANVVRWLEGVPQGICGRPKLWPARDDTWRQG